MKSLKSLLQAINIEDDRLDDSVEIRSICQNSKHCIPQSVFFAFRGQHTNGMYYIQEAIERGAVCIISDQIKASIPSLYPVWYYQVPDIRKAFALLCAAFNDQPQTKLSIIGVTGTDGKSTTSDYLYQLLMKSGIATGLLTTVSMDDGSGKVDSPYRQSTPEPDQLFAFLRRCVENEVHTVVLECTSHALSSTISRLAGITFDQAIVTKVTSEHLEFHHSLDQYIDAKVNLVRALKVGGTFYSSTENTALEPFLTALKPADKAVILGRDVPMRIESMGFQGVVIDVLGQRIQTSLLLPSLATNCLLATFCAAGILGVEPMTLLPLIKELKPVKGRMHVIENQLGLRVIVDFAHTADAYEGIFGFAKRTCEGGDLIAVFGCAGERDSSKRAPMGRIACRNCSTIILTEEDSRCESNRTIFSDLRYLMDNPGCKVIEIEDRRQAIRTAISLANNGDTLLFLGKGHEKSIERATGKIPWDEIAEIRQALALERERRR